MRFIATPLPGAFVIEMECHRDHRGFFARAFCQDEIAGHDLDPHLVQMNLAFNHRGGTLRGLHFQRAPHEEAKSLRCIRGAIHAVIVDLRPDSITRGQWFAQELDAENRLLLYSPIGFAQGYQTLQDETEIMYGTSARFAPTAASGVRYNDPALDISWPLPVTEISTADSSWPDWLG